jgi:hypothetical protein
MTAVMSFTAYATEEIMGGDFLPDDMDVENMCNEVLTFANSFPDDLVREIRLEDVDFSQAYKIYMTNIFEVETNDFEAAGSILEKNNNCIFIVPVYFEKGLYLRILCD